MVETVIQLEMPEGIRMFALGGIQWSMDIVAAWNRIQLLIEEERDKGKEWSPLSEAKFVRQVVKEMGGPDLNDAEAMLLSKRLAELSLDLAKKISGGSAATPESPPAA